jgi:hypothetical protein
MKHGEKLTSNCQRVLAVPKVKNNGFESCLVGIRAQGNLFLSGAYLLSSWSRLTVARYLSAPIGLAFVRTDAAAWAHHCCLGVHWRQRKLSFDIHRRPPKFY